MDGMMRILEEDVYELKCSDSEDEWNYKNAHVSEEISDSEEENESHEGEVVSGIAWTRTPFKSEDLPCVTASNAKEPGTPAIYFEKFFTEDFYENAAVCTSQYYQRETNEVMRPPTTPAEIKIFFGIHYMLGCTNFPPLKVIWSSRFRFDPIDSAMSKIDFSF